MITEKDLQEAIAECEGVRNPNANTCIKLAAFYTIRNEMYPKDVAENATTQPVGNPDTFYSYAGEPAENTIDYKSGTDFSKAIDGRNPDDVLAVMDELMDTLKVIHGRLYDGVMRQLEK